MEKSEPTTGEIVEVLRENGDVYFGETEITCEQIADRLESQEQKLADYAPFDGLRDADAVDADIIKFLMGDEKELRNWIVRASWHCAKVHTQSDEIAALTARAEQAEKERDALVKSVDRLVEAWENFKSPALIEFVKQYRGQPQEGEGK